MSWECITREACRESHGHDGAPSELWAGILAPALGAGLASAILLIRWVVSLF